MSQQPKLSALIFDVGDILYDASLWRRWLTEEIRTRQSSDLTYEQLVEAWESCLVPVYKGKTEYWVAFEQLLMHFGFDDRAREEIVDLSKRKAADVQTDRVPMPEVPETLAELRSRGTRLVALSDTESGEAGVRKTLHQLGIETYFDAVVSSFAIGHVKPEPEAFDFAIEATHCPKEACGFVAHDVDELAGAQAHQLFAIGYNYDRRAPADRFIERFSELLELV